MECPACHGPMWDNRETKRSPKQPDYKCKDKDCGKGVWLDKKTSGGTSSSGTASPTPPRRALGPVYNECLDFAKKAVTHHFGRDVATTDIIAAAATLFIQAAKTGQSIRPRPVAPKPAPPPPPPPPPPTPEFEDFPGEDEYDDVSSLPF